MELPGSHCFLQNPIGRAPLEDRKVRRCEVSVEGISIAVILVQEYVGIVFRIEADVKVMAVDFPIKRVASLC